MKIPTFSIPGVSACEVWIGDLDESQLIALGKDYDSIAILADKTVHDLHGEILGGLSSCPTHLVPPGEACKSFDELQRALEFCATAGLSRKSLLITLGGGAASDLGGLTAALFKRGLAIAHISTTLVGQVDAAIGGKTAIDMAAGKNLVGAFHMPRAVFADVRLLKTLPPIERRAGLGEVVKCALLQGEGAFRALEEDAPALASGDQAALHRAVVMGAGFKVEVVTEDPTEQGRRKLLNLGHTFAHAIETCSGHGTIPHGIAVGVGLALALDASAAQGILSDTALPARLRTLMRALHLPTAIHELDLPSSPSPQDLWSAMAHDKKGSVGRPEFVLLAGLGEGRWGEALSQDRVNAIWYP